MPEKYFVFSSWKAPQPIMLGLAFVGDDFVVEKAGAALYEAERGAQVPHGGDGVYVTGYRDGDAFILGTDYPGTMPLFLYRDGTNWGVSNSLWTLAEHVRANGAPLSVDWPSVHAFTSARMRTPPSFETVFSEIRLVPTGRHLRILEDQVEVRQSSTETTDDYATLLARGIARVTGLVRAIEADGRFRLSTDVTGGLDSRTSVAMTHAGLRDPAAAEWHSHIIGSDDTDLAIAREIGRELGVEITESWSGDPDFMTPTEVMEDWKARCLGYYSHLRFATAYPGHSLIRVSGLLGGHTRQTYPHADMEENVTDRLSLMSMRFRHARRVLRDRIMRDVAENVPGQADEFEKIRYAFNEFDGRAHVYVVAGSSSYVNGAILKEFLQAATHLDTEAITRKQLFYDIVRNCRPDLLPIRFDNPKKAFPPECGANFTAVEVAPADARIFCGDQDPATSGRPDPGEAVFDAFQNAVRSIPFTHLVRHLSATYLKKVAELKRGTLRSRNMDKSRGRAIHAALLLKALRDLDAR